MRPAAGAGCAGRGSAGTTRRPPSASPTSLPPTGSLLAGTSFVLHLPCRMRGAPAPLIRCGGSPRPDRVLWSGTKEDGVAEYHEVRHERLYLKEPRTDRLRKTAAARLRY